MKKLLTILIVLIVAGGCNTSTTLKETLNHSEFTESEKQDIIKLVEFFESKISIEGKNRKESYEIFLTYAYNDYYAISEKVSIEEQRKLFKSINTSTYQRIWQECQGKAYISYEGVDFDAPVPYKNICPVTDGKYIKLLERIGKEEAKVNSYLNNLRGYGDFSMNHLYSVLVDHKANWIVNFDDSFWRIIITIHILSVNEESNRYMSLSK